MKAKILIVGGGVMGTALATRVAHKTDPLRAPVVLCERDVIGSGSSGSSGGVLRQFYRDRLLALMARDSMHEYAQFEARTGRSIGYMRSGVMTLAGPDQAEWQAHIRKVVADLSQVSINIREVEGQELAALVPGIDVKPGTIGAWEPDGGFVDPVETMHAFAALARTYGTVTRLKTEVQAIHVKNGRVVGARTNHGECQTERIVLMGGAWTAKVLQTLGVHIPLRVVRPENYFFKMPELESSSMEDGSGGNLGINFDMEDPFETQAMGGEVMAMAGMHPVLIDLEHDFYARCDPALGRTRVGRANYSNEKAVSDPDHIEDPDSSAGRSWARDVLAKRMPEYQEREDAGEVSSFYTLTPDSQPVIGPVPGIEGLFVATGFSGHGFKLAPSVGEGLAQMLFDEPVTAFEPEFFSPGRFTGQEEWRGQFGF